MKNVKLIILALIPLLFVSCGSNLDGKYACTTDGETMYLTLKGKTLTLTTSYGEESGTYTFDSKENILHVKGEDGDYDLLYNPASKTLTMVAEGEDEEEDESYVFMKQ